MSSETPSTSQFNTEETPPRKKLRKGNKKSLDKDPKELSSPDWLCCLSGQLQQLREQSLFCDVVIQTSDTANFSAHASVLAAASPVLSSYMQNMGMCISYDDISGETWQLLLMYMYTGKVNVAVSDVHVLYKSAKELGVESLVTLIESNSNPSIYMDHVEEDKNNQPQEDLEEDNTGPSDEYIPENNTEPWVDDGQVTKQGQSTEGASHNSDHHNHSQASLEIGDRATSASETKFPKGREIGVIVTSSSFSPKGPVSRKRKRGRRRAQAGSSQDHTNHLRPDEDEQGQDASIEKDFQVGTVDSDLPDADNTKHESKMLKDCHSKEKDFHLKLIDVRKVLPMGDQSYLIINETHEEASQFNSNQENDDKMKTFSNGANENRNEDSIKVTSAVDIENRISNEMVIEKSEGIDSIGVAPYEEQFVKKDKRDCMEDESVKETPKQAKGRKNRKKNQKRVSARQRQPDDVEDSCKKKESTESDEEHMAMEHQQNDLSFQNVDENYKMDNYNDNNVPITDEIKTHPKKRGKQVKKTKRDMSNEKAAMSTSERSVSLEKVQSNVVDSESLLTGPADKEEHDGNVRTPQQGDIVVKVTDNSKDKSGELDLTPRSRGRLRKKSREAMSNEKTAVNTNKETVSTVEETVKSAQNKGGESLTLDPVDEDKLENINTNQHEAISIQKVVEVDEPDKNKNGSLDDEMHPKRRGRPKKTKMKKFSVETISGSLEKISDSKNIEICSSEPPLLANAIEETAENVGIHSVEANQEQQIQVIEKTGNSDNTNIEEIDLKDCNKSRTKSSIEKSGRRRSNTCSAGELKESELSLIHNIEDNAASGNANSVEENVCSNIDSSNIVEVVTGTKDSKARDDTNALIIRKTTDELSLSMSGECCVVIVDCMKEGTGATSNASTKSRHAQSTTDASSNCVEANENVEKCATDKYVIDSCVKESDQQNKQPKSIQVSTVGNKTLVEPKTQRRSRNRKRSKETENVGITDFVDLTEIDFTTHDEIESSENAEVKEIQNQQQDFTRIKVTGRSNNVKKENKTESSLVSSTQGSVEEEQVGSATHDKLNSRRKSPRSRGRKRLKDTEQSDLVDSNVDNNLVTEAQPTIAPICQNETDQAQDNDMLNTEESKDRDTQHVEKYPAMDQTKHGHSKQSPRGKKRKQKVVEAESLDKDVLQNLNTDTTKPSPGASADFYKTEKSKTETKEVLNSDLEETREVMTEKQPVANDKTTKRRGRKHFAKRSKRKYLDISKTDVLLEDNEERMETETSKEIESTSKSHGAASANTSIDSCSQNSVESVLSEIEFDHESDEENSQVDIDMTRILSLIETDDKDVNISRRKGRPVKAKRHSKISTGQIDHAPNDYGLGASATKSPAFKAFDSSLKSQANSSSAVHAVPYVETSIQARNSALVGDVDLMHRSGIKNEVKIVVTDCVKDKLKGRSISNRSQVVKGCGKVVFEPSEESNAKSTSKSREQNMSPKPSTDKCEHPSVQDATRDIDHQMPLHTFEGGNVAVEVLCNQEAEAPHSSPTRRRKAKSRGRNKSQGTLQNIAGVSDTPQNDNTVSSVTEVKSNKDINEESPDNDDNVLSSQIAEAQKSKECDANTLSSVCKEDTSSALCEKVVETSHSSPTRANSPRGRKSKTKGRQQSATKLNSSVQKNREKFDSLFNESDETAVTDEIAMNSIVEAPATDDHVIAIETDKKKECEEKCISFGGAEETTVAIEASNQPDDFDTDSLSQRQAKASARQLKKRGRSKSPRSTSMVHLPNNSNGSSEMPTNTGISAEAVCEGSIAMVDDEVADTSLLTNTSKSLTTNTSKSTGVRKGRKRGRNQSPGKSKQLGEDLFNEAESEDCASSESPARKKSHSKTDSASDESSIPGPSSAMDSGSPFQRKESTDDLKDVSNKDIEERDKQCTSDEDDLPLGNYQNRNQNSKLKGSKGRTKRQRKISFETSKSIDSSLQVSPAKCSKLIDASSNKEPDSSQYAADLTRPMEEIEHSETESTQKFSDRNEVEYKGRKETEDSSDDDLPVYSFLQNTSRTKTNSIQEKSAANTTLTSQKKRDLDLLISTLAGGKKESSIQPTSSDTDHMTSMIDISKRIDNGNEKLRVTLNGDQLSSGALEGLVKTSKVIIKDCQKEKRDKTSCDALDETRQDKYPTSEQSSREGGQITSLTPSSVSKRKSIKPRRRIQNTDCSKQDTATPVSVSATTNDED